RATKSSGAWQTSDASATLPTLPADARPREAFSGAVFELDRPEDQTKLRALVADQPNILARLLRARETVTAEILARHKDEETALLKVLGDRAIDTGPLGAEPRNPKDAKPIFLENTEAEGGSGTHPLKTLVHSDGGWGDGRIFEGGWKFDSARERFVVSLASRS